jgi:hypothetical protein
VEKICKNMIKMEITSVGRDKYNNNALAARDLYTMNVLKFIRMNESIFIYLFATIHYVDFSV